MLLLVLLIVLAVGWHALAPGIPFPWSSPGTVQDARLGITARVVLSVEGRYNLVEVVGDVLDKPPEFFVESVNALPSVFSQDVRETQFAFYQTGSGYPDGNPVYVTGKQAGSPSLDILVLRGAAAQNTPELRRYLAYTVSPFQLVQEFERDDVRAGRTYMKKPLVISGVISDISTGIGGTPYIVIGASPGGVGGVRVSLKSSDPLLHSARKGRTATTRAEPYLFLNNRVEASGEILRLD